MEQEAVTEGIRKLAHASGIAGYVQITGLKKLQGGNSSEMWAFDGSWLERGISVAHPLILRSGLGGEFALRGRGAEFSLLQALEGADLPVPRAHWFDANGQFFGRPAMVMDRCNGVADRLVMTDHNRLGLTVVDRRALGRQMMQLLAKLHAIAPPDAGVQANTDTSEELRQHDEAIKHLEAEPSAELRLASWWLWRHLPPQPKRLSIVHGDYRPANMLLQQGSVSAILDWEFVHTGDPLEDLGWFLSPYYASEHLEGGLSAEDAVRDYESARGFAVDRDAVKFWAVFAMYKLAYMTVAALKWLTEGDATRMAASSAFIIDPLLRAIARPCPAAGESH